MTEEGSASKGKVMALLHAILATAHRGVSLCV